MLDTGVGILKEASWVFFGVVDPLGKEISLYVMSIGDLVISLLRSKSTGKCYRFYSTLCGMAFNFARVHDMANTAFLKECFGGSGVVAFLLLVSTESTRCDGLVRPQA